MTSITALYQIHVNAGAQMVDFHGWRLPLHYGSAMQEHRAVRTDAGVFDVSHMTIIDISGADSKKFLQILLINDVAHLQDGRAFYTCMCQSDGGIVDDLIAYHLEGHQYRLVTNSATKVKDLAWMRHHSAGYNVTIQERDDLAILAVQGPRAIEKTGRVLAPEPAAAIEHLAPFGCLQTEKYFVGRTGYTGEDGLELIASPDELQAIWHALMRSGVQACGLASRDTLRLEAGLLLYGQDMDTSTSPLESGLGWTIAWEPMERSFIGREALAFQKRHGLQRKLVGLRLLDKGIMRAGQKVLCEGCPDGIITSGSFSPILNESIALARLPCAVEHNVWVEIRDKRLRAEVGRPRFIHKGTST